MISRVDNKSQALCPAPSSLSKLLGLESPLYLPAMSPALVVEHVTVWPPRKHHTHIRLDCVACFPRQNPLLMAVSVGYVRIYVYIFIFEPFPSQIRLFRRI